MDSARRKGPPRNRLLPPLLLLLFARGVYTRTISAKNARRKEEYRGRRGNNTRPLCSEEGRKGIPPPPILSERFSPRPRTRQLTGARSDYPAENENYRRARYYTVFETGVFCLLFELARGRKADTQFSSPLYMYTRGRGLSRYL